MIVWLNGELAQGDRARLNPADRGFTLGDGVFETLRVKGGKVLRLDRHFARLATGLKLLEIAPWANETALAQAFAEVLSVNGLTDAMLRLTISRGPAVRGIAPDPTGRATILITASPPAKPAPVMAIIATVTRRNEHSPLSRIKSTNYLDAVLARIEATGRGADDAILLNTAGWVAEATTANIFAVIDRTLVTPPVTDGALPGIVRAEIVEKFGAEERTMHPADLARADEIFLSGSGGIRPVVRLEGHPLAVGPVTTTIAASFE